MAPTLEAGLVDSDFVSMEAPPSSSRRRALLSAVLGAVALASLGTAAHSARKGPTNLAVFPAGNSTECWQMTGGTCRVMNCAASRGPTQCYKAVGYGYNCVCKDGYCSGADGVCYKKENKLIASQVTLSAQYSGYDYYLVSSSCHSAKALTGPWMTPTNVRKDDGSGPEAKWSIWQLPGADGATPAYMLVPESYPDCVVSEDYSPGITHYAHYLIQTMGPWHWGMHGEGLMTGYEGRGPGYASFTFTKTAAGDRYNIGLAADSGVIGTGQYLYISSQTSMASIWSGALGYVGGVGEWKVTPPLPDSVGA